MSLAKAIVHNPACTTTCLIVRPIFTGPSAGRTFAPMLALMFCAAPARAVDLTKIERTIAKEPAYRGKPTYCLLVFGPEAKFRAWLLLDGAVLYVDRNGDGDLTQPDKRVPAHHNRDGRDLWFKPGQLGAPDGKTKYDLLQLRVNDGCCDMRLPSEHGYLRAGFDGPGGLRFAERWQDAPIVHIGGALTLQRFDPQPGSASCEYKPEPLARGARIILGFSLGTPGLGPGTFAKYPYPEQTKASAEIRFANGKTVTTSLEPDG
ncbi:hypothetical protein AYO44_15380 [Planctomycetaceae bacterium SCGC AG-212-F19]|nr:hypothetical protein AYO44_15380 [Planctomycetaceae bacterium SCGC AG-212-F19]